MNFLNDPKTLLFPWQKESSNFLRPVVCIDKSAFWDGKRSEICSFCWFPLCMYPHHCRFHATNVMFWKIKLRKKGVQLTWDLVRTPEHQCYFSLFVQAVTVVMPTIVRNWLLFFEPIPVLLKYMSTHPRIHFEDHFPRSSQEYSER